jgi:3-hydroxyisobutyrate dehydrogenase
MTPIRRIGFVGLGNMGAPMARNLARSGFDVRVRDADPDRQELLASELGPEAAAFEAPDAVITMLPTGDDVRAVLLDDDGEVAAALRPGTVAIDMSSSAPVGTRQLGAALGERGVTLIDAPVSGGVAKAQTGTLAILVGGDDEAAIERARPVLDALGERVLRTGGLGAGHAAKALNNFVAAASFAATSEALLVGARFGLRPEDLLAALNASTGASFNTHVTMEPHVLRRRFGVGFAMRLMVKDIALARDLVDATDSVAPMCRLTEQRWADALAAEGPDADFTAAIRHWEQENATKLPLLE